jgi:penicillin-insensitive murein DD-endopeptidase
MIVERGALAFFTACLALGCMGTPSPLVPTLEGSIGYPHRGVQTGAIELPAAGRGYARFRPESDVYWGRPRLIRALRQAAQAVADKRPAGAPLLIADLSAKRGGKIPRHHSHRTGRDVDLLWYVTTPSGVPMLNPGFVRVSPDMLAQANDGFVRLDIERQWLLIKQLLASPEIEVQWMFCSRSIEALLIDYAKARGEDFELLARAQAVLTQPGDSLAHDDHIHLRIACTREEAVGGCEGGGPDWRWLPEPPSLGELSEPMLLELATEDPLAAEPELEQKEALSPPHGQPRG